MDNQYEIEVDLYGLFRYLLKRAAVLMAAALGCALLGFAVSGFLLPPQYEVSTRIYVLNRESEQGISYSDYQISNQIAADYKVLITGQNVTKEVIKTLELDMTTAELEKMITVTAPENTRVLQITVKDTDPHRAVRIANSVRDVASVQIREIMDVESVNLVYEAQLPEEPAGPNVLGITLAAAFLGLAGGAAVVTILYIRDDTIRTEEDVEAYLGASVLAVIPASAEMERFSGQAGCAGKHTGKKKPLVMPARKG